MTGGTGIRIPWCYPGTPVAGNHGPEATITRLLLVLAGNRGPEVTITRLLLVLGGGTKTPRLGGELNLVYLILVHTNHRWYSP